MGFLFCLFGFLPFSGSEDSIQLLGQIRLIELNSASVKKGDFEIRTGLCLLAAKQYKFQFLPTF